MARRDSNTTQRRLLRPRLGPAGSGGSACLVVIHGDRLGERIELGEEPVVIGRSPDCEFQINHRSVSRRHCQVWRAQGGYRVRDLQSTNRTYVNEQPTDDAELRDGDHVVVGDSVLKFIEQGSIEARYHEELYQLATSDPLTGIYNRRQFQELLQKEIVRASRHARTLVLALLDIDHFKAVNDRYGHPAGDGVIRSTAQILRQNARADQLIARIGGEEFAVVYAEQSMLDAAQAAERLRLSIEGNTLDVGSDTLRITVSIGLAAWAGGMQALSDLMRAADAQLYRAKQGGRNQVCWDEPA